MKGAGWLGIVLIAVGAIMIYAGMTGQDVLASVRSILNNEPLPAEGDEPEAGSELTDKQRAKLEAQQEGN